MSDWTKGFDLQRLRDLAAPFKRVHKPLVFGAFGLLKERDVADALAEDRCMSAGEPETEAVLIFRKLSRPSTQNTFNGAGAELAAPAIIVSGFACTSSAAGRALLTRFFKRFLGERIYFEIFEEDVRARTLVENSGFKWFATKIMAGSEIKGLYRRGRGAVLTSAEAATLSILKPSFASPAELQKIRAELEGKGWAQHYSSYNKRGSWTSFALRGYSMDPMDIIKPSEMSRAWKEENPEALKEKARWLSVSKSFPATMKLIKKLPAEEFDRVRFMRLRAKNGELTRHADITDREAGVRDGSICRLHIPIVTSPAVAFYGWDARGKRIVKSLPEGSLCYLDQRKPHAVVNEDPTLDRVHLVVDCVSSAPLRALIGGS